MKSLTFLAALLLGSFAFAADHVATITVLKDGKPLFSQSTTFNNVSDADAQALVNSGKKQLDLASQNQDKGGAYTIQWKWNDLPVIETAGMKAGPVHAVMHQGVKWLDDQVTKSQAKNK